MIRATLFFIFLACLLPSAAQPLKLMLPIGHTAPVSGICLLQRGDRIVSVSEDKTARIWSMYDQKQLALFESDEELTSLFEVPGANAFIACSNFGKAILWSTVRDSLLFRFIAEPGEESFTLNYASADLSAGGEYLALGFRDGTAAVWHLPSRKLLYHRSFALDSTRHFIRVQFTPGGTLLVAPYAAESFLLVDPATGKTITTFSGHASPIKSFAFDVTGKILVTGGGRAELLVWDALNGRVLSELTGAHRQYYKYGEPASSIIVDSNYFINQVSIDAAGRRIVSASDDGSAVVWDLEKGEPIFELPHGDGNVTQASFDSSGGKVLTSSFNQTRLWDARTGELLKSWQGKKARFERNGSISLITSFLSGNSYGFSLIDPETGRELFPNPINSNGISEGLLMGDEQTIITRMTDGQLHHWDMETGTLAAPIARQQDARGLALSHSGRRLAINYHDSTALVVAPATGKTVTLESFPGRAYTAFFSTDDSILVAYFMENGLQFDSVVGAWDTQSGKLLNRFDFPASVIQARLHPLNRELYVLLSDNTIRIYGSVSDREPELAGNTAFESYDLGFSGDGTYFMLRSDSLRVYRFDDPQRPVWQSQIYQTGRAEFSTVPGKLLLEDRIINLYDSSNYLKLPPYTDTYYTDDSLHYIILTTDIAYLDTVQVFDLRNRVLLYNFRPHQNKISSIRFTRDGNHFYTFSEDNLIRKWETRSGRMIFESFALDAENYFTRIPAGYYQATNSAAKMLHYVTKDLGVITFEQLDVKYNRPDRVLEAIGSTDTLLIRSYRQAWEKRIQRLGIDTTQFRESIVVPESDIVNRETIAYLQEKQDLKLNIRGVSTHGTLDRMNVWVNEVPIFGQRGISLRHRKTSEIDTIITVRLSQNLNRIETSVTSRDGMESYREPLLVNYVPARPPAEKVYFIGIGIDQFRNSQYDLQYSVQDVRELAEAFGQKFAGRIEVDTLFNRSFTKENLAKLKQKLNTATVHDKVIVAYSGHGLLSSDFDYFLSTWGVDFDRPETNGIPYEELESLLDGIPPRRKLMLIDACHSGELDRQDLERLHAGADPRVKGLKPVAYKKEKKLGLQSSFELMQSLFVNVSKSTGATVISAAAGTQFALEQGSLENGVFTYAVLETIASRPTIRISELKKSVSRRVEALTGGRQRPTSRSETISFDWELF